MYNPNKAVSANGQRLMITYTDTQKNHFVNYEGKMDDVQLFGTAHHGKRYQQRIEEDKLNNAQQKLYRKALYGLDACTPEEIAKMSFQEKLNLTKLQTKTQKVITKWKNEIADKMADAFLSRYCSKVKMYDEMVAVKEDPHEPNTYSFKDLGINKEMIVRKLIAEKILPQNFMQVA